MITNPDIIKEEKEAIFKALNKCRRVWVYLMLHPELFGEVFVYHSNINRTKRVAYEKLDLDYDNCYCPACQFRDDMEKKQLHTLCGSTCLIGWGSQSPYCHDQGSPFDEWKGTKNETEWVENIEKIISAIDASLDYYTAFLLKGK